MLTRIKGGRVDRSRQRPRRHRRHLDPRWPHRRGAAGDTRADETYDAAGKIVMAGAIDIHSHIAGGNVNTARLLLPEHHQRRSAARRPQTPLSNAGWATFETGCLYAAMGFTTVVEPAVAPHHALHAHLELADIPIIDKATLAVLGNDDFLLGLLRAEQAHRAFATTSPGRLRRRARSASRSSMPAALPRSKATCASSRSTTWCRITASRRARSSRRCSARCTRLGVPHPLHVHCNNLGMPGNAETALATIAAAEGLPLHLAHLQFYGYGKEGERGFSSAARAARRGGERQPRV